MADSSKELNASGDFLSKESILGGYLGQLAKVIESEKNPSQAAAWFFKQLREPNFMSILRIAGRRRLVHHLHAMKDLAEDGVGSVQPAVVRDTDIELRAVIVEGPRALSTRILAVRRSFCTLSSAIASIILALRGSGVFPVTSLTIQYDDEGSMKIRTIRGRIVLAIVLVGCIPLMIGLVLAYVSGMRSLRDVIGGTFQTVAIQAAERVTMLVQNEVQRVRLLGSAPLRVRQPVEVANQSYPINRDKVQNLINDRMQIWEKGQGSAARLLNSELSAFSWRQRSVTEIRLSDC